jgi:hypothetical protein
VSTPAPAPMTDDEKRKLINLMSIASTIKDLGEAPSGHIYTAMMEQRNITLDEYEVHISLLIKLGAISRTHGHLLKWEGKAAAINKAIEAVDKLDLD